MRTGSIALAVALTACGSATAPTPPPPQTLDPWPFTVASVTLTCETNNAGGKAVFVTTPEGTRYAVNGVARARAPIMDPIQADFRVDGAIKAGLALCDGGVGSAEFVAPPKAAETPSASATPATVARVSVDSGPVGTFVNMKSDGGEAVLSLECRGGEPTGFQVTFGSVPASPPPLRGTMATVETDGAKRALEMGWGMEDRWFPRRDTDAEKAKAKAAASAILNAKEIAVYGPEGFAPALPSTWRLGDEMAKAREGCKG